MEQLIKQAISEILQSRTDIIPLFIRQRAKFEGWLKFELASYLERNGMENVEVESKATNSLSRYDISFFHQNNYYKVELKTPNASWKINGVKSAGRPITKNIQSIVDDTIKLNSLYGIVAFVLFPIPLNHHSWKTYIDRISEKTNLEINESNYNLIEVNIDGKNRCSLLVCSYKSKVYNTYFT